MASVNLEMLSDAAFALLNLRFCIDAPACDAAECPIPLGVWVGTISDPIPSSGISILFASLLSTVDMFGTKIYMGKSLEETTHCVAK